MSQILDFLKNDSTVLLPAIVTIIVAAFVTFGKRAVERMYKFGSIELASEGAKQPSFDENLRQLIAREDITLRVLEEVLSTDRYRFYFLSENTDSRRAGALRQIQSSLRLALRDSIKSDDFATLRDRILCLIDEAQKEIHSLQQRKPFDGLQEPEKSLLVDLLGEIPQDKAIPRQKALQLADIIKLKHQDMLNLQTENAKSAAWTRWGTYGTIFFGILSIVLSIYTTVK